MILRAGSAIPNIVVVVAKVSVAVFNVVNVWLILTTSLFFLSIKFSISSFGGHVIISFIFELE